MILGALRARPCAMLLTKLRRVSCGLGFFVVGHGMIALISDLILQLDAICMDMNLFSLS